MQIAYQTAIGKRRTDNEDSVGVYTNQTGAKLALIADGIGGNQGGDVASEMAVAQIGHAFESTALADVETTKTWLEQQITHENQTIINRSEQYADLQGMGTTIVLAAMFEKTMLIGNVGDSRGYLLRHQDFSQITEDHSLVNELVKRGELSRQAARVHPKKNVITRSLGIEDAVKIDLHYLELESNDLVLLCSDGLSDMLTDEQLKKVLESDLELSQKAEKLIDLANEAGGLDNITLVIVDNRSEVTD